MLSYFLWLILLNLLSFLTRISDFTCSVICPRPSGSCIDFLKFSLIRSCYLFPFFLCPIFSFYKSHLSSQHILFNISYPSHSYFFISINLLVLVGCSLLILYFPLSSLAHFHIPTSLSHTYFHISSRSCFYFHLSICLILLLHFHPSFSLPFSSPCISFSHSLPSLFSFSFPL